MKAFIKTRVVCQGVEVLCRNETWVAPTCMNVVKLNICFHFIYFMLFFAH